MNQTTREAGAGTVPAPPNDFVGQFRSELAQRQKAGYPVSLQSTLATVSGALFAAAIVIAAAYNSGESSSTFSAGFWWSIAGVAAAYLVGRSATPELMAGVTTAFVPLSAVATIFLFRSQIEQGKIGSSLLVIGLVCFAAWLMPILRGRPALLTTSLLTVGSGLLVLMAQNSVRDSLSCSYDVNCLNDPQALLAENLRSAAIMQLVLGIALLAVAWVLDRKGWIQVGRTFIGVGAAFEAGGAWAVFQSSSDKTAGAILLTIAGALLIAVAVRESRKASLIIGGFGMFLGLVAILATITENNDSPVVFIILALTVAAGVGALAANKSDAFEAVLNRQS